MGKLLELRKVLYYIIIYLKLYCEFVSMFKYLNLKSYSNFVLFIIIRARTFMIFFILPVFPCFR
jgi:hypothetical protein